MTATRQDVYPPRSHGSLLSDREVIDGDEVAQTPPKTTSARANDAAAALAAIPPVRKAAIVLFSLDESMGSQLLALLDRSAVEAVTWEMVRLERVDQAERTAVLEEFYGLGLRRLCFVFDDLVKMSDLDIRAAFHDEDLETWALALAGAAAPARAKVMGSLSALTAERLRRHLDHLGPFRLSDSEMAQLEIADRLRRLYDRGRISLPEPSGRDEVFA
jgi:flagellar motor switch protein FliG